MTELRIGTLTARYRLPTALLGERARLDRLLRRTSDEPLALAVELARERLGIRPHELLCLRTVRVPVRLRLSAHDQELISFWSLELAEAIALQIGTADATALVRYSSRTQALADFATGVARGRMDRAWAWHRLGLSPGASPVSNGDAAQRLPGALREESTAIAPVLRCLAERGLLGGLLRRLEPSWWPLLAEAALTAAGAPRLTTPTTTGASPLPTLEPAEEYRTQPPHWLRRAPLLQAFMACADGFKAYDPAPILACATLAALDAEPGLAASANRAGQLVAAAAALLEAAIGIMAPIPALPEDPRDGPSSRERPGPAEVLTEDQPTAQTEGPDGKTSAAQAPDSPPGQDPLSLTVTDVWRDRESPSINRSPDQLTGDELADPVERELPLPAASHGQQSPNVDTSLDGLPPPADPEPAHTRFAGLLFLIPLLAELSLPQRMLEEPALADRPLALGLHLLGRTLADCDDEDAALAAFRGHVPGAETPWTPAELEDPLLQEPIDGWADQVREILFRRLEPDAAGPEQLLQRIIRRDAVIHAEPGWVELVLPMDQVSLDVRRAGLDLDPGWVPWLGVVIRYVYQ